MLKPSEAHSFTSPHSPFIGCVVLPLQVSFLALFDCMSITSLQGRHKRIGQMRERRISRSLMIFCPCFSTHTAQLHFCSFCNRFGIFMSNCNFTTAEKYFQHLAHAGIWILCLFANVFMKKKHFPIWNLWYHMLGTFSFPLTKSEIRH